MPTSSREPTRPNTSAYPVVGSVIRERIFSKVLFPAPFLPISPITSPWNTSKLTSFKAQNDKTKIAIVQNPYAGDRAAPEYAEGPEILAQEAKSRLGTEVKYLPQVKLTAEEETETEAPAETEEAEAAVEVEEVEAEEEATTEEAEAGPETETE